MFEYLWSWEVWIFVAAVVVIVIWIMCKYGVKMSGDDNDCERKKKKKRKVVYDSESSSSSEEIEVRKKRVKPKSHRIEINESMSEIDGGEVSQCEPIIPEEFTKQYIRPESTRSALDKPSKGELECLAAAERIYGVKFHRSVWPKWLKNPETGRGLELDVYNEDLKIAIEYHGRQHYQYVKRFHKNGIQDLESQKRRDHHKLDLCDNNNVYLITVPYNVPIEQIEDFLRYWDPTTVALREARKNQL